MKLSIIVITLECRKELYERMMKCLNPQLSNQVEVITILDNGEQSEGSKRDLGVAKAKGEYVVHLDDDDEIPPYYVSEVLKATELQPDAIGYCLDRWHDGVYEAKVIHSKQYDWYRIEEKDGKKTYTRPISHICPVKTEIARMVPFLNRGQDAHVEYAMRLKFKLKTEVFIDKVMYFHYWRSKAFRANEKAWQIYG